MDAQLGRECLTGKLHLVPVAFSARNYGGLAGRFIHSFNMLYDRPATNVRHAGYARNFIGDLIEVSRGNSPSGHPHTKRIDLDDSVRRQHNGNGWLRGARRTCGNVLFLLR